LLHERLGNFSADLALVNADVITMDPARPRARAVAVKDGRIVAVGSERSIRQCCNRRTAVVDLGGKPLLPGFVESHNHVSAYSHTILQIDCTSKANDSIADIRDKVAERAANQPLGTWIKGYGFDNTLLREQRFPTRHDLDDVSPDHPVHLWHISGHFTVVNSRALALAGIDRDTPDPEGGEIVRDESGEPNGVLAEPPAQLLVLRLLPAVTLDESVEGLQLVNHEYVKAGVTSTHDANLGVWGGLSEIDAFRKARAEGKFRPRVYALIWTVLEEFIDNGTSLEDVGIRTGCGDDWLRIGGVKIFADGSIPGLTAALSEPYHCDPDKKGNLIFTQEELDRRILRYHEAGFQIAVHANGDRCIQAVIDAFDAALRACPRDDHRHRLEHLPMASDEHLERMAGLGLVTTFYTSQIYGWGDRQREQFLGPERAERLYPARAARDLGIRFGLHGDCPVTPISPLMCLYTAVARETQSGYVLGPEQRISLDDGLKALTIDGAYLAFEEHIKGSIEHGKLADFVVLSADPYELQPSELRELQVEQTIIGGEFVYGSNAAST
jgi:predicted amidohydrolase YtcJ